MRDCRRESVRGPSHASGASPTCWLLLSVPVGARTFFKISKRSACRRSIGSRMTRGRRRAGRLLLSSLTSIPDYDIYFNVVYAVYVSLANVNSRASLGRGHKPSSLDSTATRTGCSSGSSRPRRSSTLPSTRSTLCEHFSRGSTHIAASVSG